MNLILSEALVRNKYYSQDLNTQATALDKELIKNRFAGSLLTYDRYAIIQRQMNRTLMGLLVGCTESSEFKRVFEPGCGTGHLTSILLRHLPVRDLWLNDLITDCYDYSEYIIQSSNKKDKLNWKYVAGDMENVDLPENIDLVISGASFQWLSDFKEFITKLRKTSLIKSGSTLAFSTFGPDNFNEITSICGPGLHYHTAQEYNHICSDHFEILTQKEEKKQLFFNTPVDVLNHQKRTGVKGISKVSWTKSKLIKFVDEYNRRFTTDKGVSLTFHPLYYILKVR